MSRADYLLADAVRRVFIECSQLRDEQFLAEHPGIEVVAAFLDEASKKGYAEQGRYRPYDNLGVRETSGLIALVESGNEEAALLIENTRNALRHSLLFRQ
jgi:hypothetical protein